MQTTTLNDINISLNNGLNIGTGSNLSTIVKSYASSQTLSLPSIASDTFVCRNTTDSFANKTVLGGSSGNVVTANNLASSTGIVSVNTTTPAIGQILTATSTTVATWQSLSSPFVSTIISANSPANLASLATSTDLTTWTKVSDISTLFNAATGIYTAPSAGLYQIDLVFNYLSTTSLTVQVTGTSIPTVQILDVNTSNVLLSSTFPILNVNIALLLNINTILAAGTIVISGAIELTSGQTIKSHYNANGYTGTNAASLKTTTTSILIQKISSN